MAAWVSHRASVLMRLDGACHGVVFGWWSQLGLG